MDPLGKTKTCSWCGVTKPEAEFYRKKWRNIHADGSVGLCFGLNAHCKRCHLDYIKARRPPEKRAEEYRRPGVKERMAAQYRLRLYGMSEEQVNEAISRQGRACAICRTIPDKKLVVDHSHTTGAFRGMLCSQCNVALGMIKDRPEVAEAMATYLREPSAVTSP